MCYLLNKWYQGLWWCSISNVVLGKDLIPSCVKLNCIYQTVTQLIEEEKRIYRGFVETRGKSTNQRTKKLTKVLIDKNTNASNVHGQRTKLRTFLYS